MTRRLLLLAMVFATASMRAEASPGAGGRGGGWAMDSTTDFRKAQDQDGVIFDKRDFAYCNRCVRLWGWGGLRVVFDGLRGRREARHDSVAWVLWFW
jgi:hypothetical protein